jgi:hypothetical protein
LITREFELTILQPLLDWPFKPSEQSLNQTVLPHLIIVLNQTISSHDNQLDEDTATRTFLGKFNKLLGKFGERIQFWNNRGKEIRSLEDLLKCFYASITVIEMPKIRAYMRIKDQVLNLYTVIERCCYSAYKTRAQVGMLSNADELHTYHQYAFDHFSIDLVNPFSFVETSLKINHIPSTFAGNIPKLAIEIMNRSGLNGGMEILSAILGKMVASCILLDITRHRSKG